MGCGQRGLTCCLTLAALPAAWLHLILDGWASLVLDTPSKQRPPVGEPRPTARSAKLSARNRG